jgi:trehalose-6-phosphate synthase
MLSFHIHSNSTSFLSSCSNLSKLEAKSEKFIKEEASFMKSLDKIGLSFDKNH